MLPFLLALVLSCGPSGPSTRPASAPAGARLASSTSSYLLAHAEDPVPWHPWGDEAFAAAQAADKPIFLSIGYATCHWCHVMHAESFQDPEIAAFLAEHFVSIKVDREARPDLDEHYLAAVTMLTGRGGWPATLVLTPEGEPIFGGGYFPARDGDRDGQRGLLGALQELAGAWRTDRASLVADAKQTSLRLAQAQPPPRAGEAPDADALHRAARDLLATWDREHGGFGRAPKFPRPSVIAFLLRYHRRTGDPQAREAALQALRAMAASAVYDPIGGGFHRYTVDAAWTQPHFERMLVDQAQLALVYLDAYQLTGDPDFARVARETLDFVARELADPAGGFRSAIDADVSVDGAWVEGAFSTWSADEARAASPEHADLLIAWLDLDANPEHDGRHVPRAVATPAELAARFGVDEAAVVVDLREGRKALFQARKKRPAPAVDAKIVTAWNGLALSAFARGALILREDAWQQVAVRFADFAGEQLVRDGVPCRTWAGHPGDDGLLEDATFLAQGLLDLYELTGDAHWLAQAAALQERADARFAAPGGGWYRAAEPDPRLPRSVPRADATEPSGASVGTLNLLRLAEYLGDEPWRARAQAALRVSAEAARERGHTLTALLAAVDFSLDVPRQIVVLGEPADPAREALLDVVRGVYLPNRALVAATPRHVAEQAHLISWLEGKTAPEPTAFVCEHGRCEAPTTDPATLRAQLSVLTPLPALPGAVGAPATAAPPDAGTP